MPLIPKKLGAMIFIFATVTPFGSLFRLFMLLSEYFYPSTDTVTPSSSYEYLKHVLSQSSPMKKHPFVNIVNNINSISASDNYMKHNMTVEEIIQAVFHQYAIPIDSFYHPLKNPAWSSKDRLDQDLQMVLPWIFAFTTLFIVPVTLIVSNALWRRSEMENTYRNKRLATYQLCLQNYQKNILAEDIIISSEETKNVSNDNNNDNTATAANDDDDDNDSVGEWDRDDLFITIPKPGFSNNNDNPKDQLRQVTGTCAICLSSYKKGETIVWSSYSECSHAFHMSCIEEWIKKNYTSSCPCCRREFIDSEVYTKMKVKMKYKVGN